MEEIQTTMTVILSAFGAITCVAGGISAIIKLFSPIKGMNNRLSVCETKLNEDYDRFQEIEKAIEQESDANKVICTTLLVLLNHEITGNGIDRLKEQRDSLEQYLINK